MHESQKDQHDPQLGMELVKKGIGIMIPLENVFGFLGMWYFGNIVATRIKKPRMRST